MWYKVDKCTRQKYIFLTLCSSLRVSIFFHYLCVPNPNSNQMQMCQITHAQGINTVKQKIHIIFSLYIFKSNLYSKACDTNEINVNIRYTFSLSLFVFLHWHSSFFISWVSDPNSNQMRMNKNDSLSNEHSEAKKYTHHYFLIYIQIWTTW